MSGRGRVIAAIRGVLETRGALRGDCEDSGCKLRLPSSREREAHTVVDLCLACGEALVGPVEGERAVDRIAFMECVVDPTHTVALVELKSGNFRSSHLDEKFVASERRAREVLDAAGGDPCRWTFRGVLVASRFREGEIARLKQLRVGGRLVVTARNGDALLDKV